MSAYRAIMPLSQVVASETKFYWFPRIPLGTITILFGPAGIGKSTAVYDILARASIGERMPMGASVPSAPDDVENARSVIVGIEDPPERVAAVLSEANADLDNIGIVAPDELPHPALSPLEQLDFLEQQVVEFRARVLYVDNVSEALLSENADSQNERAVRMALRPLYQMAQRRNIAVLMTSHPRKHNTASKGADVTESLSGSLGFVNLARSVLFTAPIGGGLVGLALAKSNYYPKDRCNTLSYRLVSEVIGSRDGNDILSIPRVQWEGIVSYSAQDLLELGAEMRARRTKKVMEQALGRATPVAAQEADPPPPPPRPVLAPPLPATPPSSVQEMERRFQAAETTDEFIKRMVGA